MDSMQYQSLGLAIVVAGILHCQYTVLYIQEVSCVAEDKMQWFLFQKVKTHYSFLASYR